ncbi:MAG TPA: glyceraldehyde 3-phosphate dehydrogenase NAD-binding domain-containing protein [Candidatus Norongarragalinales archaeon]|jgi:glyceraldehyde 3-phosphate dehydrogenase|nr:glyceraldehyde 3-phosphate dehydrogenase NAD-binding domain-containing protein [Candidatus Norongarragalinales archaeon]
MSVNIAINGFGRTGRMFLRALVLSPYFNKQIKIAGINDIVDSGTLAHLFKYDSVQHVLPMDVYYRSDALSVSDAVIHMTKEQDPLNIALPEKIDYVLDCTGEFQDKKQAETFFEIGASKVIVAAPVRNPDVTLVNGINLETYDPGKHKVISAASTTTHCTAIMAKVLNDAFKLKRALVTSIHAYTSSQVLTDQPHADLRRARAAALNIEPTTTTASLSLDLVLPELAGRINASAVRVPVPDGCLLEFIADLEKTVTVQEINEAMQKASQDKFNGLLEYSEESFVSSDILGNPRSCVFDSTLTRTVPKEKSDFAACYGWYDNEWAYANRLMEMMLFMASKELLV